MDRRSLLPCLEIRPNRIVDPLADTRGVRPNQDEKCLADLNPCGSMTAARINAAVRMPMPGIVRSRATTSSRRASAASSRSRRLIFTFSASTSSNISAKSRLALLGKLESAALPSAAANLAALANFQKIDVLSDY